MTTQRLYLKSQLTLPNQTQSRLPHRTQSRLHQTLTLNLLPPRLQQPEHRHPSHPIPSLTHKLNRNQPQQEPGPFHGDLHANGRKWIDIDRPQAQLFGMTTTPS